MKEKRKIKKSAGFLRACPKMIFESFCVPMSFPRNFIKNVPQNVLKCPSN
jgi:hypothetical protein